MTSIELSEILQLVMGVLLGVLGYMGSKALSRLDTIERSVQDIDRSLIRLDTKFAEHLKENRHA